MDYQLTAKMLHLLFKKICKEEQVRTHWKEGYRINIPEKGDLRKCEKCRGIILLSVLGKVSNKMLLNWMKDLVDDQIRDQQNGSRKDRSWTD